jgi:hypothetical protein
MKIRTDKSNKSILLELSMPTYAGLYKLAAYKWRKRVGSVVRIFSKYKS